MTLYAYFDHTTPEPQPVQAWFDTDIFPYTLPQAADLLELTQQQWDDRLGHGFWAVQGGTLVPYAPPAQVFTLAEQARGLLSSPVTINCTTAPSVSGDYANNETIRQTMSSVISQINAGMGLLDAQHTPAALVGGVFTDAELDAAVATIGSQGNANQGFDITVDGVLVKISQRFPGVRNATDLCNIVNGQLTPHAVMHIQGTAAPWQFMIISNTLGPTSTISYAKPPTSLAADDELEPRKTILDISGQLRLTINTQAYANQGVSGAFNWPDINNSEKIWPKAEFLVYGNVVANFVYQCQQVINGFSETLPSTILTVAAPEVLRARINANLIA